MKAQIREAYETLKAGVPDFGALKLLVQAATKSDEQLMDAETAANADNAAVFLSVLVMSHWEAP